MVRVLDQVLESLVQVLLAPQEGGRLVCEFDDRVELGGVVNGLVTVLLGRRLAAYAHGLALLLALLNLLQKAVCSLVVKRSLLLGRRNALVQP